MNEERTGVAPYVLLRFNPVPRTPADRRHHAALDRVAAGRRARAELRDRLLKALFEAAPTVGDEDRLRVVLPFSRAVHNDRPPKAAPSDLARAGVDDAVVGDAESWLAALAAERELLTELEDAVAAALDADRRRLASILAADDFGRAAAMTSPTLAGGAERYVGGAPDRLDKRSRKAEPKLARYAERAVTKTSPFSHYTLVARGTWGAASSGRPDQGSRSVRAEVGLLFVLRLFDAAMRHPEVASALRYRVNEAARRPADAAADAFEFELMRDDPSASRIYRTVRTRMTIPATRATELVVRLLDREPRGMTLDAVARALAEAGSAKAPVNPDATRAFVDKLRAAGFLVPAFVPDQQCPEPALRLAEALEALETVEALEVLPEGAGSGPESRVPESPGAWIATLAGQLRDLHAATVRIAELDGSARSGALSALSRQWSEAFAVWGASSPGGSPMFEDVAADAAVVVDQARWQSVRDDLLALLPALEPFSLDHPGSTLMTLAVVDRIGVGGRLPYLDFAALLREIFTPDRITLAAVLGEIGDRAPELHGLLAAREEFLRLAADGTDAAEVVVPEPLVARLAAAAPARYRRPLTSVSAFVQPVAGADSGGDRLDRAVVNGLLDGNGQFVSRFLPLWPEQDTDTVRDHLRSTLPAAATELRAVQGFNANVHPRLLDREFRVDGLEAGGSALDVRDLDVVHDAELNRLALEDRDGRRISPYYLGFLVPYFLPWEQTGLYLLSQPTQFRVDAANEWESRLAPEEREHVRHYPRLRFRSLVLNRERWYVPSKQFPAMGPAETLGAYLVRLDAWRSEHGIPPRVFLARVGGGDDEASGQPADAMGRPKPMYADLRSPLHARSLAAWFEEAATIRIDEALPDPGDPAAAVEDPHVGSSAVEYLIECYRTQGTDI